MSGRVLAKGEEFLIGGAHYGDSHFSYVTGLFRAMDDLDMTALEAEFNALDWDVATAKLSRLESVVEAGTPAEVAEANFQRWLVEHGHIERVPVKLLWVGQHNKTYSRPGSDARYVGFSALRNDLIEPTPDPDFTVEAGPRP